MLFRSYDVGGAITLYQALTGDGDDAIEGGDSASNGIPGSTPESKIYWADADPRGSQRISRMDGGKYFLADGFGVVGDAERWLEDLLKEVEILGRDLHVQRPESLVLGKRRLPHGT